MAKESILIAGGAGFIGSHLAKRLVQDGYYPILIDNLSTGRMWKLNELDPDDYTLIIDTVGKLGIRTGIELRALFAKYPLAAVYNLACPASPPAYQTDMIGTLDTCYLGTMELLNIADAYDARYIHASTSECYGDPNVSPQPESYRGNVNTLGPRACYDEGKRVAETLIWSFAAKTGLDSRIARIFNTFGPAMNPDDGRVVTNFIMQTLKEQPITIYGDGQQTRSFCYVDDTVEGLVRLGRINRAELEETNELVPVFNIGNDVEITIAQAAKELQSITSEIANIPVCEFSFTELPADDPTNRRPDLSKARKYLGYVPEVPYTEGFRKTAQYFVNAFLKMKQAEEALNA